LTKRIEATQILPDVPGHYRAREGILSWILTSIIKDLARKMLEIC
jgi:hypothetical protein